MVAALLRLLVAVALLAGAVVAQADEPAQGSGDAASQAEGATGADAETAGSGEAAKKDDADGGFFDLSFTIGGEVVTFTDILIALLIVLTAYQISRFLQEIAERGLTRAGITAEGTIGTARRAIHYTIILLGLVTALGMLGIDLQTLVTAGALFAVAFGFAMQNIAQNFVSGVILLVERTIKPGDVLMLEGKVVRVVEMGIRATVVRTLDDEEMIVPNSSLVQNTVTNYTLRDSLYRLRARVGVAYQSDMEKVRDTLEECARALDWRVKDHAPRVHLIEFGDSSVVWEVSVWIQHPWHGPRMRSRLYQAMWWALKERGITIAFPQLDLHLDARVEKAFLRANEP